MEYKGKLYAKVAGKYIECTETVEQLEQKIKELEKTLKVKDIERLFPESKEIEKASVDFSLSKGLFGYQDVYLKLGFKSGIDWLRRKIKSDLGIDAVLKPSFWFMRDNHTFVQLDGKNASEIKKNAIILAKDNPHGMVCPVTILEGDKEIRRVGESAHVDKNGKVNLSEWFKEIMQDDIIRNYSKKEEKLNLGDIVLCTWGYNDVTEKPFSFLYDFGYYNKKGDCIVYTHGNCSMQDAHLFKKNEVKLAIKEEIKTETWGN